MSDRRLSYRTQNLGWLAFAVLGTEVTWAIHLLAVYALSPSLCGTPLQWLLHLVTAVALIVGGSAFGLAFHDWRAIQNADRESVGLREDNSGFLLSTGVFLGIMMLFGIIAAEIAVIFSGCI